MTIIAVALALGAWLRFAAIGAREMSADEGASWAAAAAPTLAEVVSPGRAQPRQAGNSIEVYRPR